MFSVDENYSYCFNSVVLLILVQKTLGRRIFFWVTSKFPFIPTMTSLKGQVKYLCAARRFWKTGKSWIQQCKLHIVFTKIMHFSSRIFLKPMLGYDQGIVKIQKMRKQIFCLNHVYGSLIYLGWNMNNLQFSFKTPLLFFRDYFIRCPALGTIMSNFELN